MKRFRVRLWANLPASAEMVVEADCAEDAKQVAFDKSDSAPWDGADYNRPDGSQVESVEVLEEVADEEV